MLSYESFFFVEIVAKHGGVQKVMTVVPLCKNGEK